MGLLDLFRKTETIKPVKPEQTVTAEPIAKTVVKDITDGYAGDLEKTEAIATLLLKPKEDRDAEWVGQFLANLPLASLRCGTPQIIAGPDGFPYFQLFVPEPGEEFQSFVIDKMVPDFLLERGYGIIINPGNEQPEWILTYGDILNYYINNSFFKPESPFGNLNIPEEVKEGEEITIGQPSESVLPKQTRKLLREFFELNGIESPKILLMIRKNGEEISQDLAFNITPEFFESVDHYRNMMQTVTWYLPRHYSILGLQDEDVENGFMLL